MNTNNSRKNVLLVDDEIDICDFLSEYLEDKSIKSFSAIDIETALKIAKENRIDLIFLDNNLLRITKGVEYIPHFKLFNPQCKVYMLTANHQPSLREHAQLQGADGFILKPFEFDEFQKVIDELITEEEAA